MNPKILASLLGTGTGAPAGKLLAGAGKKLPGKQADEGFGPELAFALAVQNQPLAQQVAGQQPATPQALQAAPVAAEGRQAHAFSLAAFAAPEAAVGLQGVEAQLAPAGKAAPLQPGDLAARGRLVLPAGMERLDAELQTLTAHPAPGTPAAPKLPERPTLAPGRAGLDPDRLVGLATLRPEAKGTPRPGTLEAEPEKLAVRAAFAPDVRQIPVGLRPEPAPAAQRERTETESRTRREEREVKAAEPRQNDDVSARQVAQPQRQDADPVERRGERMAPLPAPESRDFADHLPVELRFVPGGARIAVPDPERGDLRLQVQVRDGVADFQVAGQGAWMVDTHTDQLRAALAREGLQLGKLDHAAEGQTGASAQQHQQRDGQQPSADEQAHGQARNVHQQPATGTTASETAVRSGNGRLHVEA